MGLTNNEQLLQPISDAAPAGDNLEYDPAFLALERAAQGKPEQRMGASVVPGEPPEWGGVLSQATALLARTKDLRVAVHLTAALLNRGGLEGICDGLVLVSGLLEKFWPTVHPQLDPEEGDDPTMRITALAALTAPSLLATLRTTPVVRAQALGIAAFRDMSSAQGEASIDAATLEGIFQSVDLPALEAAVGWLGQCIERLSQIDKTFETHTGSRGPDLTPMLRIFRDALNFASPRLANRRPAEVEAAPEAGAETTEAPAARRVAAPPGEVNSREDVVRAIDRICAYYARFEPSSPLPLLLQRCKKLVPMSFVDILKEIAPSGLPQLETVVGKTDE
ncbi:MAG: type VI secretion system protein TssA [Myxococcota bacterium]